jgi:hypothetical protein
MWTGRQTLGEIEGAISKLRRDESQLDSALSSATSQAEKLRHDRTEAFRELARVKLDEISAGRLLRNLDAAEQRALQVLESRRLRLESVNAQRQTAMTELEQAEAQRHEAAAAVERALEEVEEIRAAAESRVRATPAWTDARKAFDAADGIAREAEAKAKQSETELSEKKKPYDQDRLFAYLWANGYGTSRYSGGNIARWIDGTMADYISFSEARSSYHMLTEIPLRLREHASRQRKSANELSANVGALERQAMIEAGIEPKERALAQARHKLAASDATAEKKRNHLREVEEQRNALVDGTGDAAYTQALTTIATADAQDDIGTLYREAQRTKTPSDDMIVRRIGGLDERLERLETETAELRKTAKTLAQRRSDVERVRDRFRSSGYDHPNARFGNENEIGRVLAQILEGAVRSGILWDLLRGGFGTKPSRGRPDFGSPTFPFPFPMPGGGEDGARGGEWREPGTRGGWSIPPIGFPSRRRSDDDDDDDDDDDRFSTGGRF